VNAEAQREEEVDTGEEKKRPDWLFFCLFLIFLIFLFFLIFLCASAFINRIRVCFSIMPPINRCSCAIWRTARNFVGRNLKNCPEIARKQFSERPIFV